MPGVILHLWQIIQQPWMLALYCSLSPFHRWGNWSSEKLSTQIFWLLELKSDVNDFQGLQGREESGGGNSHLIILIDNWEVPWGHRLENILKNNHLLKTTTSSMTSKSALKPCWTMTCPHLSLQAHSFLFTPFPSVSSFLSYNRFPCFQRGLKNNPA